MKCQKEKARDAGFPPTTPGWNTIKVAPGKQNWETFPEKPDCGPAFYVQEHRFVAVIYRVETSFMSVV